MFNKSKPIEAAPEKNKLIITLKDATTIRGKIQDLANIAATSSTSTSANSSVIVEGILTEALLPKAAAPLHYTRCIYKHGLKETYIAIMSALAAGVNNHAAYDNALPLVKFLLHICNRPFASDVDENYNYLQEYFKDSCRYVRRILERIDTSEMDFIEAMRLEDNIQVLARTEQGNMDFIPYNYVDIVLNNWDVLGDNTFCFRHLYSVCALSSPHLWDSSELRIRAAAVIDETTASWEHF